MISRDEIRTRSIAIIRSCVPNLREAELTDSSVVNTDMGMDSMSFILVVCKLEAGIRDQDPGPQMEQAEDARRSAGRN